LTTGAAQFLPPAYSGIGSDDARTPTHGRTRTARPMDIRLAVMGAGGVGKSSLTIQFVQGHFLRYYDPTIEDFYRTQRSVDGEVVMMEVLDTAGQDEYTLMRDAWVRTNDVFLLVFSVTERRSFEEIDDFYQRLLRVKDREHGEVPLVLLANKVDLAGERNVTSDEAKAKADALGCPLIETSAKDTTGVAPAFEEAVREHRKWSVASGSRERERKPRRQRLQGVCSIL